MIKRTLRWVIGALANLTPNVVYYPKYWEIKLNDNARKLEAERGTNGNGLTSAAIMLACSMNENLPRAGDSATISLSGVTDRAKQIGDFEVIARRIA